MTLAASIVAGDTLTFTTCLAAYPADEGWTLTYRLIPRAGGDALEIEGTADEADPKLHRTLAAAAVTADWTPGAYSWAAYATKSGERYTVGQGTSEVLPDLGVATSHDARSHARRMLDAIEAWLERRDPGVAEYQIAGRAMKYHAPGELLAIRSRYRQEVAGEEAALRLAAGLGGRRRIQFRG